MGKLWRPGKPLVKTEAGTPHTGWGAARRDRGTHAAYAARVRRGRRRALWVVAGVLVALALALAADLALAWTRLGEVEVTPRGDDRGTTWLLVGSDSRERLDADGERRYRDPGQATGERADVMVLLRIPDPGADGAQIRAVAVPRDLFVTRGDGAQGRGRLGMWLAEGADSLARGYCDGLGVGVDHVAVVDFAALVALADAAGGVRVEVPRPVRDRRAGLAPLTAGVHRLDGEQTLAWVRSRHPEELVAGRWRAVRPDGKGAEADSADPDGGPVADDGGADRRAAHLADVLRQLAPALARSPLAAHRALWAAGPHVRLDEHAGPLEAARLVRALASLEHPGSAGGVAQVPARHTGGRVPVAFVTPETTRALALYRTAGCPSPAGRASHADGASQAGRAG